MLFNQDEIIDRAKNLGGGRFTPPPKPHASGEIKFRTEWTIKRYLINPDYGIWIYALHANDFLTVDLGGKKQKVGTRKLILDGDLNVAPLETDVWNHKKLLRSVGHTPGESERMLNVLAQSGLVDAARHFVPPSEPLYTWWGYRFPASFEKDYGWRLDHIWASEPLLSSLGGFQVVKETRTWERPSDHVPVMIEVS